jgi:penicillin amidase
MKLLRFLYGPEMGDLLDVYLGERAHRFGGLSSFAWRSSSLLIRALNDPAWPEKCGHHGLSWRDALLIAVGEAVSELRLKLGESVDDWSWGAVHQVSFDHPLARVRPLKRLLSRGPFPIGGDVDTPLQAGSPAGRIGANVSWAPSYRQIIDFGDLRESVAVQTTGQSGHPASPHYDDMLPLWLKGRDHPMLWERADVEEHLVAETRLIPADERWG